MSAQSEAVAEATETPTVLAAVEAVSRTKLCGRCRKPFDRDPADPPAAEAPWWLCPPCHEALVGGVGRARRA